MMPLSIPGRHPLSPLSILNQRWKGLQLHVFGVVLIVTTWAIGLSPSVTLVLGGITVTFVFATIGMWETRRSVVWFTPLSFYFFWSAVGLGVAAIYLGVNYLMVGQPIPFLDYEISPPYIQGAYVIYVVGSLAFHIGVELLRPTGSEPKFKRFDIERNVLLWTTLLWAVGMLYQLKNSWFSPLGTIANLVHWAAMASVCFLILSPRKKWRLSPVWYWGIILAGTVGVFVGNVMTGSKSYIMFSFLPLVWFVVLRKRPDKVTMAFALCLAVFYFGVVAPGISRARVQGVIKGSSLFDQLAVAAKQSLGLEPRSASPGLQPAYELFFQRQFDPLPLSFILGEVERDGFRYGETMAYASYAFIPRLLWPDKPFLSKGSWFTAYLGFSPRESEATTSTGITATGELYWNFGIPGVVLGMLFIGMLIGAVWRLAGADPRGNLLHMLLYTSLLLDIMNMPEAVTTAGFWIAEFLVFGAVFLLLGWRPVQFVVPRRTPLQPAGRRLKAS
jgi:hypothetical protein